MRSRRPAPAAKSPLPLILGGGVAVLVVVIAVAASGGKKPPPPKAVEAAPEAVAKDRSVQDTGYIMFVCANSGKHADKEIVLPGLCPACAKASSYYWDAGLSNYRCFACAKEYPQAKIACPECGKVPVKTRLKHR
ncbi:MAG TPA: hypothetical protein VF950_25480 [Planctomycetota bacterium]